MFVSNPFYVVAVSIAVVGCRGETVMSTADVKRDQARSCSSTTLADLVTVAGKAYEDLRDCTLATGSVDGIARTATEDPRAQLMADVVAAWAEHNDKYQRLVRALLDKGTPSRVSASGRDFDQPINLVRWWTANPEMGDRMTPLMTEMLWKTRGRFQPWHLSAAAMMVGYFGDSRHADLLCDLLAEVESDDVRSRMIDAIGRTGNEHTLSHIQMLRSELPKSDTDEALVRSRDLVKRRMTGEWHPESLEEVVKIH